MRMSEEEYKTLLESRGKAFPKTASKPNKYHAKKVWMDGICFDSGKEARFYADLKLLCRIGELDGFTYHGKVVCTEGVGATDRAVLYEPDFVLFKKDGTYRIVDTKGVKTPVFQNKIKAIREKYPNLKIELE